MYFSLKNIGNYLEFSQFNTYYLFEDEPGCRLFRLIIG